MQNRLSASSRSPEENVDSFDATGKSSRPVGFCIAEVDNAASARLDWDRNVSSGSGLVFSSFICAVAKATFSCGRVFSRRLRFFLPLSKL